MNQVVDALPTWSDALEDAIVSQGFVMFIDQKKEKDPFEGSNKYFSYVRKNFLRSV